MKTKWKYISLFLILAIGISAPIHLGYFNDSYNSLTNQWIISEWIYLFAGLGPFIAAIIGLIIQENLSSRITIFGGEKLKYTLIAFVPLAVFAIVGFENSFGINTHLFGFIYVLINLFYAFLEELGWRRYLQNALEGINRHWKYIFIGVVWWLWHMRFETQFDLFIFPVICIGGGYLLGKLTDDTKSILPAVTLHTLIILLTNSGSPGQNKIMGVVLTILGWLIIEWVWKRKANKKS